MPPSRESFQMLLRLIIIVLLFTLMIFPQSLSKDTHSTHTTGRHLQSNQPSLLTLVSWNMQWLSVANKETFITRTTSDFTQLARILADLSPDILAFQEVDSISAIEALLPSSKYKIFLSDRLTSPNEKFAGINQFTGFAIKNGLPIDNPPDLKALNIRLHTRKDHTRQAGRLRYGSYIIVRKGMKNELHLLNIHLKSGCFSVKNKPSSRSCRTLRKQASALTTWIQQRLNNDEDYIVLGDFNHRLNSEHQWLLTSLNQKLSLPAFNLTENTDAACLARHTKRNGSRKKRLYRSLVDHALGSEKVANSIKMHGQVYQYQYATDEVDNYQLSDHCPLVISLPSLE